MRWSTGYSHTVPPEQSSTPSEAAASPGPDPTESDDTTEVAERIRYLDQVMAEIDLEVQRRRASGDLPASLETELDELFLEFSPVGLHGKARLRETLALVDGSAYVDIAVPVASEKAVGTYVKRLIKAGLGWYMGFIVHQIIKFAWSVSRMFHVVVDHVEDLESEVATLRTPELPRSAVPRTEPGSGWWVPPTRAALRGRTGRVLHADCGHGGLIDVLLEDGVDAYGVDPDESVIESAVARGLDVRAEAVLDHLEVVAPEALSGVVLTGTVQWLHPNQRDRLVSLLATRLAGDATVVIHSATPESWATGSSPLVSDLAPGRPLHPETWMHLLAQHGFAQTGSHLGGDDRRLERVAGSNPDATAINAAIDVVNSLLLGPGEFLLVAARSR